MLIKLLRAVNFIFFLPLMCNGMEMQADDMIDYLRIVQNGSEKEFQSAAKTFVNEDLRVTLLSAIHMGEAEYFASLQKVMDDAEIVLYEGMKAEKKALYLKSSTYLNSRIVRESQAYGLLPQLDCINYSKENFLHADIDQEFVKVRSSPITLFEDTITRLNYWCRSESLETRSTNLCENQNNIDKTRLYKARILPSNEIVKKMTKENIDLGKKDIVIFYGAIHMKDIEKYLVQDLNLTVETIRWFTVRRFGKPLSKRLISYCDLSLFEWCICK